MNKNLYKKKYLKYKNKYLILKKSLKGGSKSFIENRSSILLDLKRSSRWSYDHSERVSWLCNLVSEKYNQNKDFIKLTTEAGLFHDLGKECINKDILNSTINTRKDDVPSDIKNAIIDELKKHPEFTKKILDKYTFPKQYSCKNEKCLKNFPIICGDHHEKLNGNGYPEGKKDICIITQIVTVCDIYDSLRSARPYKSSRNHEETISILKAMNKNKGLNDNIIDILDKINVPELWIYNNKYKLSLIENT